VKERGKESECERDHALGCGGAYLQSQHSEADREDLKFEVTLGYIKRTASKNKVKTKTTKKRTWYYIFVTSFQLLLTCILSNTKSKT
jgi:hypothetical protein